MTGDPPKLRVVGPDERAGDDDERDGSLPVVLEDLDVAHGHVIEATAELHAVKGIDPKTQQGLLVQLEQVKRVIEYARKAVRAWMDP